MADTAAEYEILKLRKTYREQRTAAVTGEGDEEGDVKFGPFCSVTKTTARFRLVDSRH